MRAPLLVLAAWLVFAGSHLALGLPPLRDRLARRLGEQRFVALFGAVAAAGLALLALAVAAFGDEGPAGAGLAGAPAARFPLAGLAWAGLALAVAGLLNYMRSPMALFRKSLRPPAGIERVTRHAFFIGLALFAVAHALLAPTLAVALYFAGFAALALAGAPLQDRKLLARHGPPYAEYLAMTSTLPFAAIAQGRQAFPVGEGMPRRLALAALIATGLLAPHPLWSTANGALLAGLIAAGGVFASARRWRHATRTRAAARPTR